MNYTKSDDWWKEVLVLTKDVGVDLVFDSVGLVDKSLKCLKHKGRILVVGFAGTGGYDREDCNEQSLAEASSNYWLCKWKPIHGT